jgi:hypothetical protein
MNNLPVFINTNPVKIFPTKSSWTMRATTMSPPSKPRSSLKSGTPTAKATRQCRVHFAEEISTVYMVKSYKEILHRDRMELRAAKKAAARLKKSIEEEQEIAKYTAIHDFVLKQFQAGGVMDQFLVHDLVQCLALSDVRGLEHDSDARLMATNRRYAAVGSVLDHYHDLVLKQKQDAQFKTSKLAKYDTAATATTTTTPYDEQLADFCLRRTAESREWAAMWGNLDAEAVVMAESLGVMAEPVPDPPLERTSILIPRNITILVRQRPVLRRTVSFLFKK